MRTRCPRELFYARFPVEIGQTKLAPGGARKLLSSTGKLPIIPSEDLVIKPKIEIIKTSELYAARLDQLFGGTGGGSTPPTLD